MLVLVVYGESWLEIECVLVGWLVWVGCNWCVGRWYGFFFLWEMVEFDVVGWLCVCCCIVVMVLWLSSWICFDWLVSWFVMV